MAEQYTMTISGKDPDLLHGLGLPEQKADAISDKYFKYGEYYTVELTVDENFQILAGRFVPKDER